MTSNAAKCSRSCGVTMPDWWVPWKSYGELGGGLGRGALARPADREGARHPGGGRAAAEEPAS